MKIRTSFVTNSSSASYIVHKNGLDKEIIDLILNPSILKNKNPFLFEYCDHTTWSVKEDKENIYLDTSMDNFDYYHVLEFLGVSEENIEVLDGDNH